MVSQAVGRGDSSPGRWSRAQLITFRFAFVFTGLSLPHLSIIIPAYLFFDTLTRPVAAVIVPVANGAIRAAMSIGAFIIGRVSGDRAPLQDLVGRYMQTLFVASYPRNTRVAAFAEMLGLVIAASLVTIVWSYADRRRANYERLYRWMRVGARYTLALVAMVFAMTKVVPTQFGFLGPGEVLRPVGSLSESHLLWDFMAASTLYTVFAGLVELLGIALLFFRRTTAAGALMLGAALTNVAVIDVGYRVGAGAFNILLLLLTLDLIVLIPYLQPAVSFLFLGRAAALPHEPGFLSRPWRYSAAVSALVFALLVSVRAQDGFARRRTYFGVGRPVWGIFNVENFARNGMTALPVPTEGTEWRRIATGSRMPIASTGLTVQFANGDVRVYALADDVANHVWRVRQGALTTDQRANIEAGRAMPEIAMLRYAVQSDGTVTLDGRIGQDSVKMRLRRIDPADFPLLGR